MWHENQYQPVYNNKEAANRDGRAAGGPTVKLTDKELEALTWSAHGKTSWEIARISGCSESAVNFHFNNIRNKFNVHTRREAVIEAFKQDLIRLK
jgi:LuxR family quorum-sensing transcriptional regulator LasR